MAIYMWREYVPPELCFTANTAWSTIKLTANWNSASPKPMEISTDWITWNSYTMWNTITLANVWDKVYMRNASTSSTQFSTWFSNYYQFIMTWSIAASWDVNYLVNKDSVTTLNSYCFYQLFMNCTSLTSMPKLTAATLWSYCYNYMFFWCSWLTDLSKIEATILSQYCFQYMFCNCTSLTKLPKLSVLSSPDRCYDSMFYWCSKIKLSTTQTWEYQTPYRIPSEWTGTAGNNSLKDMFKSTWWTFSWTPTINTTYYTSNTVV